MISLVQNKIKRISIEFRIQLFIQFRFHQLELVDSIAGNGCGFGSLSVDDKQKINK